MNTCLNSNIKCSSKNRRTKQKQYKSGSQPPTQQYELS